MSFASHARLVSRSSSLLLALALAGCVAPSSIGAEPTKSDEPALSTCGGTYEETSVRPLDVGAEELLLMSGTIDVSVLGHEPLDGGTALTLDVPALGTARVWLPVRAPEGRTLDLDAVSRVRTEHVDRVELLAEDGAIVVLVGELAGLDGLQITRGEGVCLGMSSWAGSCWLAPGSVYDGVLTDDEGTRRITPGARVQAHVGYHDYELLFAGARDYDPRAAHPEPRCANLPIASVSVALSRLVPEGELVTSCNEAARAELGAPCEGFHYCGMDGSLDAQCEPVRWPACVSGVVQRPYQSGMCVGASPTQAWRAFMPGDPGYAIGRGEHAVRARVRWARAEGGEEVLVDCADREVDAETIDWRVTDAEGVLIELAGDTTDGACVDWLTILDVDPGAHELTIDAGRYHTRCAMQAADSSGPFGGSGVDTCVMRLEP